MKDLLIINVFDADCFTTCKESEVNEGIERAREYYKKDKSLYESHLVNYPDMADYWKERLEKTNNILKSGFKAVAWDEYCKLQREKWLSKEPEEITKEEYDYALNVLPPKNWVWNERYSMFFIGECTTMTFYGQYLYDKISKKYYTALTDILDESTWLDKMLKLR